MQGWKKATKNSKCIVFGDLNVDFLRWHDPTYRGKKLIQVMKDEIVTLGYGQLIDKVTRSWPGTPSTLVDHIWTNTAENIIQTSNCVRAASDHNTITAVIRTKNRKLHVHDVVRRNKSNMNVERYRMKIKNVDWGELFDSQDVDIVNDIFVSKVGAILDEEAPFQNVQFRKNFRNWLTPELKAQMTQRDNKREEARRSGDAASWRDYRRERNRCTKNMNTTRNNHYNELYEKLEKSHDVKNIYNVTKRILNWEGAGAPQSLLSGEL